MQELISKLNIVAWTICFILIGIAIIIYINYPKILGWFGEHWTKKELKRLSKDKYRVINDVFIINNGMSHQIDHVVVSPYEIFSIETKQYNGRITGTKYDKYWVRKKRGKKYYYNNPIRQNYGHVKALCELLKIDESKIYNIVCIPSRHVYLKIQHDGEIVTNITINEKILSYNEEVLSDIDNIVDIIEKNNITDKKLRKDHIKNIRNNIIDKDTSKCPRCGGQLVERKGRYGYFLGCSNYPKCKYTSK